MDNKTIWRTLEKIKDLPTLPSVYFKLNQLLKDNQASIEKVAHIIELDPAMSSRILHLVNSAFYGVRQESSSIAHAVMILGFNAVKNAVVSVAILDTFTFKDRYENFDITEFWRHAVSVAVLSKQLAEEASGDSGGCFIAGLLHDIGKIIMLKYFKEDFGKVWKTMQKTKCSFADAEQEVASMDHVQVGAYLARKWQLPEPIIQAIAGHHYYLSSSESTGMIESLMLADALANSRYQINPDDYVLKVISKKHSKPLMLKSDSWISQAMIEIDLANEFFLEGK